MPPLRAGKRRSIGSDGASRPGACPPIGAAPPGINPRATCHAEPVPDLSLLTEWVSDSPVTYLVVFALVAADAIVPLAPGESAVVAAAVLAADGALLLPAVWAAAAAGAIAGDSAAFLLGRGAGGRLVERLRRRPGWADRLDEASDRLRRRGAVFIPAAQFVPGGRNLVMVAAGALGVPWRRFLPLEILGACLWATFQCALGWFGGRAFEGTGTALLVSLGIAIAIGIAVDLGERVRRRRVSRRA